MFVIAYPEPRIRAPRYYRADEARDAPAAGPQPETGQPWTGRRMRFEPLPVMVRRYWEAPATTESKPPDNTAPVGPSRNFYLVRLRRY